MDDTERRHGKEKKEYERTIRYLRGGGGGVSNATDSGLYTSSMIGFSTAVDCLMLMKSSEVIVTLICHRDFSKVGEEGGDELKIRSESLLKQMHEKEKELTQCKAQVEVLENQVKVSICGDSC